MRRGALEIRLEDGWGTYWHEPGEAGVPPQLDVNGVSASLGFPPPERFDDGFSQWAGYSGSVSLPVSLADGDGPIEAKLFIGICQTICVPVQASLTVDPAMPPGWLDDLIVERAFSALPGKARAGFKVEAVEAAEDGIEISVALPEEAETADIFLAGPDGLTFATPEHDAARKLFRVRFAGKGRAIGRVDYTLVADGKAVDGSFVLD